MASFDKIKQPLLYGGKPEAPDEPNTTYTTNLKHSFFTFGALGIGVALLAGFTAFTGPIIGALALATFLVPAVAPALNKFISGEGKSDPATILKSYKDDGKLEKVPDIEEGVNTKFFQRPSLGFAGLTSLIFGGIAAAVAASASVLFAPAALAVIGTAAIGAAIGSAASASIPSISRRFKYENALGDAIKDETSSIASKKAKEQAKSAQEEVTRTLEENLLKAEVRDKEASADERRANAEQRPAFIQEILDKGTTETTSHVSKLEEKAASQETSNALSA